MGLHHEIRVRYGEVDMQRVVFNANYLAYCDDAADLWFRKLGAALETEPIFTAVLTYIAVRTGTTETVPVPDSFRAAAS
jgi:YbgC/YbaW family acyl-CoA thioester hydrolase